MFSRLDMGHTDFQGQQFVYCKPFKRRQGWEHVFFIPPRPFFDVGGRRRHREFDLALDIVWCGWVTLLFKMTVRTDSNQLQDVECAMIDVFFDYAEGW